MSTDTQNTRLLYVEDDEALASVTIRALCRHNIDIEHCADIDEAGKSIISGSFDWALLDLKVGNETSLKLIEQIKAQQANTRIIVLTGYGSIATAVKAIKLGALDYLTKPVSVEHIINAFEGERIEKGELDSEASVDEGPSLKQMEWDTIQKALMENGGNISATARQLKMHRRTLQRKLQKKPVSIN